MPSIKHHSTRIIYGLVSALCLCVVVIWVQVHINTSAHFLKIAVLDIGQGDAIFIESPEGEQILVDSGPDNSVLRELPNVMPWFDRTLTAVVETHPDADHIEGFIDLLERYSVGAFIEPGIVKTSQTAKALEKEILDKHIPRYIGRRGMVIDIGGGAVLRVLYPDHDVEHINQNLDNDGGIVLQVVYGSTSALLMADVSDKVEDQLITLETSSTSNTLKSDILKVGHHGSKTSSESPFLSMVQPTIALISVGAHNKFHHPTEEALSRLSAMGAEIHRTDQEQTIEYESDGTHFWRVK